MARRIVPLLIGLVALGGIGAAVWFFMLRGPSWDGTPYPGEPVIKFSLFGDTEISRGAHDSFATCGLGDQAIHNLVNSYYNGGAASEQQIFRDQTAYTLTFSELAEVEEPGTGRVHYARVTCKRGPAP